MHHRRALQPRLVACLLLLVASASLRAAEPEGPAALRPLLLSQIPTCADEQVGKPCPGRRATLCTKVRPDMAPRCLSNCAVDADCERDEKCVGAGLHQEGPKRCVPKEIDPNNPPRCSIGG